MLRYVRYKLKQKFRPLIQPLLAELEEAGIDCQEIEREGAEKLKCLTAEPEERERGMREVLVITDDMRLSSWAAAFGLACIGAGAADGPYFDGAELVVQDFEEIDRQYLEEYLLRFHGLPVTIARTERLILREIAPEDVEMLYEISREPGMKLARADLDGENSFEPDRLRSYIREQYRLYGYGLWSVFLRGAQDGENEVLIGCCGFAGMQGQPDRNADRLPGTGGAGMADEFPLALEMEYMLSASYRRRGFGMEMCRAALSYAADRLDARQIWVRVHPENRGAQRFAASLGFREQASGTGCRESKAQASGTDCREGKAQVSELGCREGKAQASGTGCREGKAQASGTGCREGKAQASELGYREDKTQPSWMFCSL